MLAERNIPNHGLRVFVSGGGCSGLQYGMAFEAQAREFDTVVDQNGVKLFIDPTSLMYLAGASVDFRRQLDGRRLQDRKPECHVCLRLRPLLQDQGLGEPSRGRRQLRLRFRLRLPLILSAIAPQSRPAVAQA